MHFLKAKVRTIPHFPKQGIMFRDISTLLQDAEGFNASVDDMVKRYSQMKIDAVAGIESRGFLLAGAVAHRLGKGVLLIRKAGKLPHQTIKVSYTLEYGNAELEIHTDAVKKGQRVLILDDLLATGGTMEAACRLVEQLGGIVVECGFIIELPDLKGRAFLAPKAVYSQISFEGD